VNETSGLRRVLEVVAPTMRAALHAGSFVPSSFATPLAIAALAIETPFTVAVTATSSDAEHVTDALRAWLGEDDVALWPGWDTHPLERVSPDAQVMALRTLLRWQIAEGVAPRVIVASARSLAQVLSPEGVHAPLAVRRGAELGRDDFVAGLVALGYRREQAVEHRAELAVRGGIVDVWPAQNDEPIRLDFFGDEIERLTRIDISTQRSTGDVEVALVASAREWLPRDTTRQRADELARRFPWASSTLERLATGQLFDGMEGWMGLFVDQPRTLLDEVAGARVLVVEPDRVRARLGELLEEERELTDVVAATWKATTDVPLLHVSYEEALEGRVDVALESSAAALGATGQLTSPPPVQGDAARIAAHVRSWSPRRRGVVLTSSAAAIARMAEQLRNEGLEVTTDPLRTLDSRITVLESTLPSGFALDEPEVVVWSESDLTGRRSQRRVARARSRTVDGFFDDLSVGSYVVHRQHGVARFSGTTTRAINGVTRDYLILEFKDGQQLLADRADRRADALHRGRRTGALAHGRRGVAKDSGQGARRGVPRRPGTRRPLQTAKRR
jgi:transcription-repair coupling factor (superfamily II helicase)